MFYTISSGFLEIVETDAIIWRPVEDSEGRTVYRGECLITNNDYEIIGNK